MGRLCFSVAFLLPIWAASSLLHATEDADVILTEADAGPASDGSTSDLSRPPLARRNRVLFVISPDSERCTEELTRLSAAGGPFELMQRRGWKIGRGVENHIQIVDRSAAVDSDIATLIAKLPFNGSPVVIYVEDGEIARSFQRGCTTPLDQWTFGWLMTGNDERPVEFQPEPIQVATTGHYPLRGNHWSVNGDWSPSREYVIEHLRSTHAAQLQPNWEIETWSLEELRSVHDDLHDQEEGFRGRYRPSNRTSSSRSSSGDSNVFRKPGNSAR